MHIQLLCGMLLVATAKAGMLPSTASLTPEQVCERECRVSEICYVTDVTDCRRFIVCTRDPRNVYTATVQYCAFGTYWNGKSTCDRPENVRNVPCFQQDCAGITGQDYAHPGNCKEFWRCGAKGPVPRCCTNGTYFDTVTKTCVNDILGTCMDQCSLDKEPCVKGQLREDYDDGNCKTYWNCQDNSTRPVCCPDGQGYNRITDVCEVSSACIDDCPSKYRNVCTLRPGRTPNSFVLGDREMNCSGGTLFDQETCTCGDIVANAPDTSCLIELDVSFQNGGFKRVGSQRAGIYGNLEALPGPAYRAAMSHRFDGGHYYRVQYFQQTFPKIYMNLIYQPADLATGARQILLSNCMNLDIGGPSFELYLLDGRIALELVTDAMVNSTVNGQLTPDTASISVSYVPSVWNRYTIVYNGQNVYVLNEVLDQDMNSPATYIMPETAVTPLTGAVSAAAEGLDIGRCYYQQTPGYVGSIAQLQFTKCLKQEWIDAYNAVAERINRSVQPDPMGPAPA